jgi:hypothetical protein
MVAQLFPFLLDCVKGTVILTLNVSPDSSVNNDQAPKRSLDVSVIQKMGRTTAGILMKHRRLHSRLMQSLLLPHPSQLKE